jgi:hypothetical protein
MSVLGKDKYTIHHRCFKNVVAVVTCIKTSGHSQVLKRAVLERDKCTRNHWCFKNMVTKCMELGLAEVTNWRLHCSNLYQNQWSGASLWFCCFIFILLGLKSQSYRTQAVFCPCNLFFGQQYSVPGINICCSH